MSCPIVYVDKVQMKSHHEEAGQDSYVVTVLGSDGSMGIVDGQTDSTRSVPEGLSFQSVSKAGISTSMRRSFIFPAYRAGTAKAYLSDDSALLLYNDGIGRIWNLSSKELRRSIDLTSAAQVLAQEAWRQM